jgi:hypothetical protein
MSPEVASAITFSAPLFSKKVAVLPFDAYFSDRGRPFQPDRGRRCSVMADDHRGARATG